MTSPDKQAISGMAGIPSAAPDGYPKMSRQATYGALKRRVLLLRQRVSDYDAETDKMKRIAERKGGAAARFAVDSARSPAFHALREKLRKAEADYAAWKPAPRKPLVDQPYSAIIGATISRFNLKARGK